MTRLWPYVLVLIALATLVAAALIQRIPPDVEVETVPHQLNPSPADGEATSYAYVVPTTTTSTAKLVLRRKRATATTTTVTAAPTPVQTSATNWDRLADCESGDWDRNRNPIPGTARWDDNRGGYEGGVHFAPSTWDAHRDADMPEAAYLATREQQIVVAERVLAAQGPGAWPVCSYKAGMR